MTKGTWEDEFVYHWKYYVSPARPASSEIGIIENVIGKKKVNLLVLGSTPEYRNMCGNLKIPVTCFDFSKKNYDYLGKIVYTKFKEKFIQGNWLVDVSEDKYDVILGDLVLNVIKKEEAEVLLKNVVKTLKKDGMFITRTYNRRKGETITPEQVMKNYREKNHVYGIVAGTKRDLFLSLITKTGKDHFTFGEMLKLVEEMYKKGLMTKEEMEFYRDDMCWKSHGSFVMSVLSEDWLERLLKKHFKIIDKVCGTEPYLKDKFPTYVLKKR